MTDLRQAAQQALEALETLMLERGSIYDTAITALRAALAQPEQQAEPCIGKDPRCPCQDGDACHYKDCGDTKAWPVPQAKPVSCRFCHDARGCWTWQCYNCGEIDDVQKPPPAAQRPWVGLTEFQFAEIYNKWNDTNGSTPWGLNQALEAKLRKRNT